jgi:hypothetical protein
MRSSTSPRPVTENWAASRGRHRSWWPLTTARAAGNKTGQVLASRARRRSHAPGDHLRGRPRRRHRSAHPHRAAAQAPGRERPEPRATGHGHRVPFRRRLYTACGDHQGTRLRPRPPDRPTADPRAGGGGLVRHGLQPRSRRHSPRGGYSSVRLLEATARGLARARIA